MVTAVWSVCSTADWRWLVCRVYTAASQHSSAISHPNKVTIINRPILSNLFNKHWVIWQSLTLTDLSSCCNQFNIRSRLSQFLYLEPANVVRMFSSCFQCLSSNKLLSKRLRRCVVKNVNSDQRGAQLFNGCWELMQYKEGFKIIVAG